MEKVHSGPSHLNLLKHELASSALVLLQPSNLEIGNRGSTQEPKCNCGEAWQTIFHPLQEYERCTFQGDVLELFEFSPVVNEWIAIFNISI